MPLRAIITPESGISASEVFSVFFRPEDRARSVAVLYRLYFDDSADGSRQKYVIAGGLLGSYSTWRAFEEKWKKALREEPRIQHFHTKEWKPLTGEFWQFTNSAKWPKPSGRKAADEKRKKLVGVINSSNIRAIAVGILVQDFERIRQVSPEARKYFREDPYEAALQSLVYESAKIVSERDSRGCIGYVSDDGSRSPVYSAIYHDFKKKNPEIAEIMRGISHLDDTKWPGLQAADIVAHVANQVFKEICDKPEGERTTDRGKFEVRFGRMAYWDLRYMCHVLRDAQGIDLFDQFGLSREIGIYEKEARIR
jgi:hypothetical protein